MKLIIAFLVLILILKIIYLKFIKNKNNNKHFEENQVNNQGEINYRTITKNDYDEICEFYENIAAVKKGNKWGFITIYGQVISEPKFDDARDFKEGLAGVKIGEKWGFIDKFGELKLLPAYDEILSFCNGKVPVRIGEKWGIINRKGEFLIEPTFECTKKLEEEDFYVVEKNGKWKIIKPLTED